MVFNMTIEIVTKEFVKDDGQKMRELVSIKALGKDALPIYYTNTVPSFWVEEQEDGKIVAHVKSLNDAELVVGESYPADYFYHFVNIVKAAGFRLAHLKPRERHYKI